MKMDFIRKEHLEVRHGGESKGEDQKPDEVMATGR
jgi:hypothetical protein